MSNTPPDDAQAPIEMHHFGSGICSQIRWSTGSIFMTTRPATIMRSHWRGEKRMASAPKRAMSCREAPVAISSMPQHAVANGIVAALGMLNARGEQVTRPIVVRLDGNNAAEGRAILRDAGLKSDGASLLDLFRKQTLSQEKQNELSATVRRLGGQPVGLIATL